MPTVSGPLKLVTDRPALVTEVWVRSQESRPYGSGLLTDFNDVVPVTNGQVSFTAVPGAAVLVLVQPSGPQEFVPIIVGEGASQTLAEVVQAGRLAQGRSAEDLGSVVRTVQATLASAEKMHELMAGLVARSEQSARDARGAESGARSAESGAKSSATAAASSATAAKTSESNAKTAETNASKSASAASSSAAAAKTSETNAKTAESNASKSASAAASSVSAAKTSETNAGRSATSADLSARDAGSHAEVAGAAAESAGLDAAAARGDADRAKREADRAETQADRSAGAASYAQEMADDASHYADEAKGHADRAASIAGSTRWDGDRLTVNGQTSPHLTGPAPTISENGTWVINGEDTGLRAIGKDGSLRFEDLTQQQRDSLKPELLWGEIKNRPAAFPPDAHNHAWSEITQKPTVFPSSWGQVSGKPSTFPPGSHRHQWSEVDGKPTTYPTTWAEVQGTPTKFPPEKHEHPGVEVSVLMRGDTTRVVNAQDVLNDHQATLDGLAEQLKNLPAPTWSNLEGKPTTYPPATHSHDLLDTATDRPTPGTLVKRYTDGTFEVKTPIRPNDAANKGYVDTAVAGKADVSALSGFASQQDVSTLEARLDSRPPAVFGGGGPPPTTIPGARVGDWWVDESAKKLYRITGV